MQTGITYSCHGFNILKIRFPLKNESLLAAWTKAISRKDWTPGIYDYICSEHFKPKWFNEKSGRKSHQLQPDAVSSVFTSFPSYMQSSGKSTRKSPRKYTTEQPTKYIKPSPLKVKKAIN